MYVGRFVHSLRWSAIALFSVFLFACGQGEGPEQVEDPRFSACKPGDEVSARCPLDPPPPPPAAALPVDFEDAGGPYVFGDFGGGVTTVLANPDMTGNASAKVVRMQKFMDQTFGGTTLTLNSAIDFSSGETITMKVWSTRVVAVTFKIEDGGDTTSIVNTTGSGWETLSFDFSGRTSGGVTAVSIFFDNGILGDAAGDPDNWTFYFDDIELGSPPPAAGNLATNGDFELGNLSGWSEFPGGGSITADNTENNTIGGTWSGKLVATGSASAGQDVVIKQANLAVGTVVPGDIIDVAVDLLGSLAGAGGVVFIEVFSEVSGGGTSANDFIGGGALTPTGTWTTYSGSVTAGPDVSGGITLQLKAGCGAVDGCVTNAYFDNISISIR